MTRRHFAAGLALILGCYGIHWFYLRRPGRGVLYILLAFTGLSIFLGIVDAVRWLWMSNTDFERRYGPGRLGSHGVSSCRPRNTHLYSVQTGISAPPDDRDIERLRREWRIERYDPTYGTHDGYSGDRVCDDIDDNPVINPATGLPMISGIGGLDSSGHPYGSGCFFDDLHHWHRHDDGFGRIEDDAHSPVGDSHFRPWDH